MDRRHIHRGALAAALLGASICAIWGPALAKPPHGEAFASKNAAVTALMQALRGGDSAALLKILGPEAKAIVSSGDTVADKAVESRLAAAYDQMHRFATVSDGRVFLYLGADNWPMPIPLIQRKGKWYFDTAYGRQEILARRIGRNELDAIKVCEAVVQAQQQYASQVQAGEDGKQYAQKFLSDDGKHDGLFWKTAAGEPASPLGPLIAAASAQGYRRSAAGKPNPYHGYIYRMLKEQGAHATGGAKSYLRDGKLTGGFAVLAYPASYRSSGVMTFVAGQDGVVYEKDLGPDTGKIAASMVSYDPDGSWQRADQGEDSAGSATDQG